MSTGKAKIRIYVTLECNIFYANRYMYIVSVSPDICHFWKRQRENIQLTYMTVCDKYLATKVNRKNTMTSLLSQFSIFVFICVNLIIFVEDIVSCLRKINLDETETLTRGYFI